MGTFILRLFLVLLFLVLSTAWLKGPSCREPRSECVLISKSRGFKSSLHLINQIKCRFYESAKVFTDVLASSYLIKDMLSLTSDLHKDGCTFALFFSSWLWEISSFRPEITFMLFISFSHLAFLSDKMRSIKARRGWLILNSSFKYS